MIRFIIFAVLCYLLYRLIRGIFLSAPSGRKSRPSSSGRTLIDEMVMDPVCRVYIPKRDALTARVKGQTVYFCSHECMNKFFQETPGKDES